MNSFPQINVSPDMLTAARSASKKMQFSNEANNLRKDGESAFIGCIGEEMARLAIPGLVLCNSKHYDGLFKGLKIEIKSKLRSVVPNPTYNCSITSRFQQRTDYYMFMSLIYSEFSNTKDIQCGFCCGLISAEEFKSIAIPHKKGDPDGGSFTFSVDCLTVRIDQLTPLDKWLSTH